MPALEGPVGHRRIDVVPTAVPRTTGKTDPIVIEKGDVPVAVATKRDSLFVHTTLTVARPAYLLGDS
jgi:hypothetical protein